MLILRYRDFTLLWVGQVLSLIGDWLLIIALPFHVYVLTKSALATGLVYVAEIVPMLLLGPLAGVFADRWDRRKTMIACDITRAVVLVALLLVVTRDLIWVVYPVMILRSSAGLLFQPAKQALVTRLVPPDALVAANSLNMAAMAGATLLGPVLGGFLLAAFGFPAAVILDSVSFVASAIAIGLIAFRQELPGAERVAGAVRRVAAEFGEGLAVVRGSRVLKLVLWGAAAAGLASGALSSLIVPFVVNVLGGGSTDFGAIVAAQGLGGLIGAATTPLLARVARLRLLVTGGLFAGGALILVFAHSPALVFAVVTMAAAGTPAMVATLAMQTLMQQTAGDRYIGRVFALWSTIAAFFQVAGAAAAGGFAGAFGPVAVFTVAAGLLCLTALAGQLAMAGDRSRPVIVPKADLADA